ncbi:hypothetical protein [Ferruginibacter sp. SUN106]|uniref:hypothetical protein n=1 Tax=Ferruginibacter sp. SUN106 TaxID=2978348 RepID=UPI003D36BB5A
MKKSLALLIVYFFVFSTAFGQLKNLILTREQNNKWMDSVKTLPFDQQLLSIRDRLLADTNVYVRQLYNDRIKTNFKIVDSLGNRKYGDGKPLIIIDDTPFFIDNKTATYKIVKLATLLNQTYIKEVYLVSPNDPAATAIYGYEGRSGIIIMTLTKKKYFKKFKQLQLKPNY